VSIDVHNHIIPQSVIDLCSSEPAYGVTVADGCGSSGVTAGSPG